MIGVNVRVQSNKDAGQAVADGTRKAILDAAQTGVNTSLDHVPHGATSGLAQSVFGPAEDTDGAIVWGYAAEYARFVEEGTRPHWAPIRPLKKWARRVLGDEDAAYAVQQKIAKEGTEGQHFVEKGVDAMVATLRAKGISAFINEEL